MQNNLSHCCQKDIAHQTHIDGSEHHVCTQCGKPTTSLELHSQLPPMKIAIDWNQPQRIMQRVLAHYDDDTDVFAKLDLELDMNQGLVAIANHLLDLPELQLAKSPYDLLSDKSKHKYQTIQSVRNAIVKAMGGNHHAK